VHVDRRSIYIFVIEVARSIRPSVSARARTDVQRFDQTLQELSMRRRRTSYVVRRIPYTYTIEEDGGIGEKIWRRLVAVHATQHKHKTDATIDSCCSCALALESAGLAVSVQVGARP
jgi:hypothetical protein